MNPWWGREADAGDIVTLAADGTPILYAGDHTSVAAVVRSRIAAFTPEWSKRSLDAGEALVRLFGEQTEALLTRVNRWPQKALVELLITAGITQRPATPSTAFLTFTVATSAGQSVLVPEGAQAGAQPVGGSLVVFETDADLIATPSTLVALYTEHAGALTTASVPIASGFLLFGTTADNGDALWLGLDPSVPIWPSLAVGFGIAPPGGTPAPVSGGGVSAVVTAASPLVSWQLLDGTTLGALEVLSDDTGGLTRSGVITLSLPKQWGAGVPTGASSTTPLRWLRVGVGANRFATPPQLTWLALNCVHATAATTVLDEVLDPLDSTNRTFQLSSPPILPGSLVLAVDEGDELTTALGGTDDDDDDDDDDASAIVWQEVTDLAQYGPDDRVYVLDPTLGTITTGDGVNGAAVPPGFGNVIARSYRTGGGSDGAVDAAAITTLIGAAPFVTAATNPEAASGGDDVEPEADAILRGPQEIRARGRAVTLADYELMALSTPLADVRRAFAMSRNPLYPDVPMTGVVGVLIVPAERGDGPPIPDGVLLSDVVTYLTTSVAPAGVEVVAAAAAFHTVSIVADIVIDPSADTGTTVAAVLAALDAYLDPLTGGDEGQGWPFGGAVIYEAIARQIVGIDGVLAVPTLQLVVDGVTGPDCSNVPIPAYSLVWPAPHQVIPVSGEVS
jgi:predicted phage baseplate assembly protein